ncbi:MAG: isochorismatase family protein [Candidatus Binatia bacterium]|nr:isochorismatase family protein [Candidatus Binatia bacterium]
MAQRGGRLLERHGSVVVLIDVQESYRSKIFCEERFSVALRRLLAAARIVGIPIVATEQYPRGLGPTWPELKNELPEGTQVLSKRCLSCWGASGFGDAIRALARPQVVVCGLEAHACVNQTVHDLLYRGFQVHVPYDAVSSRFELDYRVGLEKMISSGAIPATVEMVAFEWLRTADAPEFRAVQQLFK